MTQPSEARILSLQPKMPTMDRTVDGKGSGKMPGKTGHARHGSGATPARLKLANGRNDHTDSSGNKVNLGPFDKRQAPDPPPFLYGEEYAIALDEWSRVSPSLASLGLLKLEDRAALTAYCLCWQRLVTATSQGEMINASRELRAWCVQFGMTPSSEQKLPSQTDEDDPFDGGIA